jgi:chemotaxis protein MotB
MAKKKSVPHGGAWKVAYADFVTAMMALFMVLWICGQRPEIIDATSRYFREPYKAFPKTSGILENQVAGTDKSAEHTDPNARPNEGFLRQAVRDFNRLLNIKDNDPDKPVDIEVTPDGLKITLYDRNRKPLFKENTAQLTQWGNFVIQTLAWLIERYDFRVYIDGHTSKGPASLGPNYGPWELSADRANAARRGLEFFAVEPSKMERVTGFGDTAPLPGQPPSAESNRRITVSLSLQQQTTTSSAAPAKSSDPLDPDHA